MADLKITPAKTKQILTHLDTLQYIFSQSDHRLFTLSAGVPQGCVLSPLIYSHYTYVLMVLIP